MVLDCRVSQSVRARWLGRCIECNENVVWWTGDSHEARNSMGSRPRVGFFRNPPNSYHIVARHVCSNQPTWQRPYINGVGKRQQFFTFFLDSSHYLKAKVRVGYSTSIGTLPSSFAPTFFTFHLLFLSALPHGSFLDVVVGSRCCYLRVSRSS